MGFKDIVASDLKTVFFNESEFADMHLVDGREMTVIIDQMELVERQKKVAANDDGLYTNQILIYIPVADYGARPKIGKQLVLDGRKTYKIMDVMEEMGLYSFTLEAVRA